MNCKTIEKNLIPYVEGELAEGLAGEMQKHLASCKHCAALHGEIRSALGVLGRERISQTDPWFFDRLVLRMEKDRGISSPRLYYRRILQPVAASLVLGAAIFFGIVMGKWYSAPLDSGVQETQTTLAEQYSLEMYLNEMDFENIETILLISTD
jgi:anti-sigma factor RsiW